MFLTERQQQILAHLRQHGTSTVQQLVDFTGASDSSVRRDLTELEKQQIVERQHGAATLRHAVLAEKSLPEKAMECLQEKQRIMKRAAQEVGYGECIYIDAGSTTMQIIPHLVNKNVTVVTNGIMHVPHLMEQQIQTIMLGGEVKMTTQAVIGAKAITQLQDYYFDRAFIGANGFSAVHGYTTADLEEATLKKIAMQQAKRAYVVADGTKYEQRQFAKFGELQQATLITSTLQAEKQRSLTAHTEVYVV